MDKIQVEKKWNQLWNEQKVYSFDEKDVDNKHYVLEMFSYPSGAKLHIGHWYNYGLTDSYARYQIMKGKNVFQPMGFDAFGLPAENYAIKTGVHPQDSTFHNIAVMEEQLKNIGAMFDWDHEIITCSPEYYRWTQWLFCELYNQQGNEDVYADYTANQDYNVRNCLHKRIISGIYSGDVGTERKNEN